MVYLDYSATMPPLKEVKDNLPKLLEKYIGNPNSFHNLGIAGQELIAEATKQIAELLNIKSSEIIYTSGATESNNHALKMICEQYQNRGRKILTTKLEHPSIKEVLDYLETKGFEIEYLDLKKNGVVDLENLIKKVTDDVILVTIGSVNSETGIRQPIEKIGRLLKDYLCVFHSDLTQSIGKEKVNFTNIDLASFSGHKFGGLKGIGVLYKTEKLVLQPMMHGGRSFNKNRAGTPPLELIASMALALRLSYQDWQDKYKYVEKLNQQLVVGLQKLDLFVNISEKSIPHIVNFSVMNIKSSVVQQLLATDNIYISTQTACAYKEESSLAVYVLTGDKKIADHSLRISLSYQTTEAEIKYLLKKLKIILKNKGGIL